MRWRTLFAGLVLVSASLGALADDVVVLTNGREARGRIVQDDETGVRLDVGGGKMFYPRKQIAEVRRGVPSPQGEGASGAEAPSAETREEHAVLYEDGRRVGVRSFRVTKTPEGFRFEEEVVFLDGKGVPEMELRVTEHSDGGFLPLSFQVRESAGAVHRMASGEVHGGRLHVSVTKDGEKTQKDDALPTDARFPLAARELFLRESKALGGKLEATVFETREQRWRPISYAESGSRPVTLDGVSFDARVVTRRRGELSEREWLDDKGAARIAELNGESLRAIATTAEAVARLKRGDTDRVTGKDSAARTRYADPEGGWRIGKPDPSWTFELPAVRGAGALLEVRNAPLSAAVDVFRDMGAAPDVTVERAAESLQRLCRSIAEDFRVLSDGYTGEGGERVYWMEATATTKGERTRTLGRVIVKKGRVYRLLAACPAGAFDALHGEFVKILDSFAVE